jgi:small conductance mechanosensitive channel
MNEIFGINIGETAYSWIFGQGIKIMGIFLGAYLIHHFNHIPIEKTVRSMIKSNETLSKKAEKKREDTLIKIFSGTIKVLVWIIAGMMILSEIGIDIGPILATAGVAGLAFGFGGQYLIRDIISGLFIILENQYRVGDVVCIENSCGEVEDITLRMTILRDLDGTVHHIPNGEIKKASNLSKGFSRVNLNIGVSYSANLERVIKVINRVGNEMAEDLQWKEAIKKAPQFLRVNEFADSAIIVKILGDTEPLKQWEVAGEFRKRIKIAFDQEGIEIPFPQRVVEIKNNN